MPTVRQVALVTGAGRRLGRQIALALGQNGFDVVINYNRSRKGADETAERIRFMGSKAIAVKADVSKRSEVSRMVRKTIRTLGRIDLLVNNASVFIDAPMGRVTDRIWNSSIDINLKGYFLCSQLVSPFMLKQKKGKIINIASLGGIQPWARHIPYSVSKAGVIMLTKCMAKALAPEVLVNAIAPGTIIMEGEEDPRVRHVPQERIPLGRYGRPADLLGLLLYLARDASYITGQVFMVDGGRSIR